MFVNDITHHEWIYKFEFGLNMDLWNWFEIRIKYIINDSVAQIDRACVWNFCSSNIEVVWIIWSKQYIYNQYMLTIVLLEIAVNDSGKPIFPKQYRNAFFSIQYWFTSFNALQWILLSNIVVILLVYTGKYYMYLNIWFKINLIIVFFGFSFNYELIIWIYYVIMRIIVIWKLYS